MLCSICKYGSRYKYCETCGNNVEDQVNLAAPGMDSLVRAYDVMRYPQEDYQQSLIEFREALKHRETFPPVLLMVTLFEYGMSMVKIVGGGPLKKLSTSQLNEFTRVLKDAQQSVQEIPKEAKKDILHNYEYMIRSNLNEAKRVLESRDSQQISKQSSLTKEVSKMSSYKSLISKGQVYLVSLNNGDNLLFRIVNIGDDYFTGLPLNPAEPSRYAGEPRTISFSAIVSIDQAGPPWSYYSEGEMYEHKAASEKDGGCFIATAVYNSPLAPELIIFRRFRDEVLLKSRSGILFIEIYYWASPPLARRISKTRFLRVVVRYLLLEPVLRLLKYIVRV